MKNRRLFRILAACALILSIPLIAMQFSHEVHWTVMDFLLAAALLFGAGLGLEFILRKVPSLAGRIALCAVLLTVFLLTWAELAVGIFGSPIAGS